MSRSTVAGCFFLGCYLKLFFNMNISPFCPLLSNLPPLSPSADLLRMFFDCLYDEDVISEDAFYLWETSKDPAEQLGKGVALKSVTAFFTWLREAEDESDNS